MLLYQHKVITLYQVVYYFQSILGMSLRITYVTMDNDIRNKNTAHILIRQYMITICYLRNPAWV